MVEIKDLSEIVQSVKEYERILDGQLTNNVLAYYYDVLGDLADTEEDRRLFKNKAENLRTCHKVMFFKHYSQLGVKDYQKTIYCHDRYCPLCQKLKANTREMEYRQMLTDLDDQYDFYHMVLTLKNVRGKLPPWSEVDRKLGELKPALGEMGDSYKHLIRIFSRNVKIAGLDFLKYGYAGAVRSLEITYENKQIYHPHFHSIVALRKGLRFPGKNVNKFSYDKYTGRVTPFSDFEILLQKLWYLILNDKKVTLDAINALPLGYSCWFKKVLPGESHDVFKYIVKPDEKKSVMSFEVFQDLVTALKGFHSVQCYGIFRKYKLVADNIDESFDSVYDHIIEALNRIEYPVDCIESPKEVKDNILAKKCLYVSRKSVRSFINRTRGDDDEDFSVNIAAPEKLAEFMQTVMPGVLDRSIESLACFDGWPLYKIKK